jgi:hypothetical protein
MTAASTRPASSLKLHAQRFDDRQLGAAEPVAERPHQRHGQDLADRWRQPDHDLAHEVGLAAGDGVPGAIELMQDAFGIDQEVVSRIGQLHAAPVAVEQPALQLGLQRVNLSADRRLRGGKNRGRAAEAAVLGHVHEVLDLAKVHGRRSDAVTA